MNTYPWSLVGNEWAVRLLQSSLALGRLPHALLLTGPSQVGKRTLALAMAAALTCQSDEKPCGRCRSCLKIDHGTHPDVRPIQAESGERSREGVLKIEQVRELQRDASLAPMEASHKVFILCDFDRANLPAANALLKILEEPPPSVYLVLTSARPKALPPTVISRCQILALRPVPYDQIAEALVERWGAGATQAHLVARLSEGRMGWAVSRLADAESWQERTCRLVDARELPQRSRTDRLAYAEKLARTPVAVLPTLALWLGWWRDLLLVQSDCANHVSNVDLGEELQHEARRYSLAQARSILARLQAAPRQLNQNANSRLVLETLLLHLPSPLA